MNVKHRALLVLMQQVNKEARQGKASPKWMRDWVKVFTGLIDKDDAEHLIEEAVRGIDADTEMTAALTLVPLYRHK